jgi:RNA polymerase sigma-70 factor (ECF subfamily)
VLLMQHRDGMSYEEMAVQLGVSTHMVKKYVVKALALCRRDLARYG